MTDRSEQFDDLVRRAQEEPHRKGDKLRFRVRTIRSVPYSGTDEAQAKAAYLANSGAMRIEVDTNWERKPKFFHDGDDPEEGLALRAGFNEIEIRLDGEKIGQTLAVDEAQALIGILKKAVRYAKPKP